MLRIVLLGILCGVLFGQSLNLKFSNLHKGINRFSINDEMDVPKTTQELEEYAVNQLHGSPSLLTRLQKLRDALLVRGQPLGSFNPLQSFAEPHTKPSYHGKTEARPGMLQGYSIKSCSKKPELDTFVINQLILKPDPVDMPGDLTFLFNISVTQQMDEVMVALDLKKKIGQEYIKIPCIGQYGSCTYNVCDLLDTVQTCPQQLEDQKFECKCPFLKGSYVSPEGGLTATIQAAIFPSGDYMMVANITRPAVQSSPESKWVDAGCYVITLTIGDGN